MYRWRNNTGSLSVCHQPFIESIFVGVVPSCVFFVNMLKPFLHCCIFTGCIAPWRCKVSRDKPTTRCYISVRAAYDICATRENMFGVVNRQQRASPPGHMSPHQLVSFARCCSNHSKHHHQWSIHTTTSNNEIPLNFHRIRRHVITGSDERRASASVDLGQVYKRRKASFTPENCKLNIFFIAFSVSYEKCFIRCSAPPRYYSHILAYTERLRAAQKVRGNFLEDSRVQPTLAGAATTTTSPRATTTISRTGATLGIRIVKRNRFQPIHFSL